jgi:hypothetical protein
MSPRRYRSLPEPVFGKPHGKQCAKCRRWFDYANYYRGYNRGYVEVCTKCIQAARNQTFSPPHSRT